MIESKKRHDTCFDCEKGIGSLFDILVSAHTLLV